MRYYAVIDTNVLVSSMLTSNPDSAIARIITSVRHNTIIPMYDDILEDILDHRHTHYVFPGGRGSTKSSFTGGISIPLLIMANPTVHAVCFRKVGNTIQTSIFPQVFGRRISRRMKGVRFPWMSRGECSLKTGFTIFLKNMETL